jgi:hypothetical protein
MTSPARLNNQRGAMLIYVAISILTLLGFTIFVCDYGVVWVSRAQAQNAADAGALGGALALAYDEPTDTPAPGGIAETSARQAAQANLVWGTSAIPVVAAGAAACPAGVEGRCARVDVFRDGTNGSVALPAFFGPLLGVSSQRVRATATARVLYGNTTNCMRPWAVADKWNELRAPTTQFDRWERQTGSGQPPPLILSPADEYIPPSADGPGSGYRLPNDLGVEVTLKNGNPSSGNDPITPGWFLPVRLPDGTGGFTSGADDMREAIAACVGEPVSIGQYLPLEDGAMIGPTSQGFDLLHGLDPSATWDASTRSVIQSCAPASCGSFSPRIVPLPVFDINDFQFHRAGGVNPGESGPWSHCPGGGKCVKVVNILGFFADRMSGTDVIGQLLMYPGPFVSGVPSVGGGAAWLVTISLVR